VHATLLGNNDIVSKARSRAFIARLNLALLAMADEMGVDLLNLDIQVIRSGCQRGMIPDFGIGANKNISPRFAPCTVSWRSIDRAKQGRSYKCLVMDLDNTLWGVIGMTGWRHSCSARERLGRGYSSPFRIRARLSARGDLLARVFEDEGSERLEPFEKHPEMILKRGDIGLLCANWSDKAGNIRAIAESSTLTR